MHDLQRGLMGTGGIREHLNGIDTPDFIIAGC
jgi:hypothetical protein